MSKKCDGCQHIRNADDFVGFCYMFDEEPETLPCGQHDKYKEVRKATAKRIRKNPLILHLLAMEIQSTITMPTCTAVFNEARYPMNSTTIKRKET
jgi:hypothetical protein